MKHISSPVADSLKTNPADSHRFAKNIAFMNTVIV
jgi:hypothetical protein